jgi:hypothetical protein
MPRRVLVASCFLLPAMVAACGKKGPPLPPLRPVPAAVDRVQATRQDDRVRIAFTVPAKNADGRGPADLERLEVYGLTIDPAEADPSLDRFLKAATLVGTVEVKPPPEPEREPPPEGQPPPPPDPRPGQGDAVSVDETLGASSLAPVAIPPERTRAPAQPPPLSLAALRSDPGPVRAYLVLGFSHAGRRSLPSTRAEVLLGPAPTPPSGLAVRYTATTFTLSWSAGAPDPWEPIWPALQFLRGVNVYDVDREGTAPRLATPINPSPVLGTGLDVPGVVFDAERCFALRTIETRDGRSAEGALSQPVCETPRDTFPPAAPTGLAAVAGPGVISLIWDASKEADLKGYLVLRAEAPGETLRPVTPAPIRETTYRDTDVRPGVRYVYAVVAVDTATPANLSALSSRVEETAR